LPLPFVIFRAFRAVIMLSRVANSLYWMSRYIERAESIARLVDVNRLPRFGSADTACGTILRRTELWTMGIQWAFQGGIVDGCGNQGELEVDIDEGAPMLSARSI